jgi:predicted ATP-grasp superfamily ATP-dependent carboligase
MPLSLNRQKIEINDEFCYLGNMVNVAHPREGECMKVACQVAELTGVRGLCGVDIVLADEPYVIDVNPRMTTSFVGAAPLMKVELAELVLRAQRDDLPAGIELHGTAEFNLKDLPSVEVLSP